MLDKITIDCLTETRPIRVSGSRFITRFKNANENTIKIAPEFF